MPSGKALNLVSRRIAGRHQRPAQRALGFQPGRLVGGRPIALDRLLDHGALDPELVRQQAEEAGPTGPAEAKVGRGDARRLRPRQDLAAAGLQAGAHLGAKPSACSAGRSGSWPPPNGSSAPAAISRSARLQRPSARPTRECRSGSASVGGAMTIGAVAGMGAGTVGTGNAEGRSGASAMAAS